MKLSELIKFLEKEIPPSLQEAYDNAGLQVGEPSMEISSAVLSLDPTEEVIDDMISRGDNLLLTHHPLIFGNLKNLTGKSSTERMILKVVRNNIAVYSAHTNLDSVKNGVSYRMAQMLGLRDVEVLVPKQNMLLKLVVFVPLDHVEKVRNAMFGAGAGHIGKYSNCSFNSEGSGTFLGGEGSSPFKGEKGRMQVEEEIKIETIIPEYMKSAVVDAMLATHPYEEVAFDLYRLENDNPGAGFGCVGNLEREISEKEFLDILSSVFAAPDMRFGDPLENKLKRIAVMGGSGGPYVRNAVRAGADAYITGDIKYHSWFEAEKRLLLVDIGHYESELPALDILYEIITKKFPTFAVRFSEINTNPVNYLQVWQKRK